MATVKSFKADVLSISLFVGVKDEMSALKTLKLFTLPPTQHQSYRNPLLLQLHMICLIEFATFIFHKRLLYTESLLTMMLTARSGVTFFTETFTILQTPSVQAANLWAGSCYWEVRCTCTTTLLRDFLMTRASLCPWCATRCVASTPIRPST